MAPCGICTEVTEVRHISLYIEGSEGLNVCHECDMMLVSYVRHMKHLVATAKMMGVKIGRREIA